jgi:hypothetical protein
MVSMRPVTEGEQVGVPTAPKCRNDPRRTRRNTLGDSGRRRVSAAFFRLARSGGSQAAYVHLKDCSREARASALDRGCVKTIGSSKAHCVFGHVGSNSRDSPALNRALSNLQGMQFGFSHSLGRFLPLNTLVQADLYSTQQPSVEWLRRPDLNLPMYARGPRTKRV